MLIIRLLILFVMLVVIPFFVGGIFSIVESGRGRRMFQWISGQFLIWVGIELIAVGMILKQEELEKAMILFWWYIGAVVCYALGTLICQKVRRGKIYPERRKRQKSSTQCKILWCVFGALLLFQLGQVVWNYYLTINPEELHSFYVTSPFSMWIAFLAKTSGLQPEMIEQAVLPVVFLCMSYGVFYLLSAKVLIKKREYRPVFLVILSILAIVGGYVYKRYGGGVWQLSQSKTEIMMLGCVLLPYLLFLLVLFGRILCKKKHI